MEADGFRNLIRLAQAGDTAATERLFRVVLPHVESLVRAGGVPPGESVSDRAQDTCVRILSKLSQFRGANEATDDENAWRLFCGWMRHVEHTVRVNTTRRRAPRKPVVSLQLPRVGESTERGEIDLEGREKAGSVNVREAERGRLIQQALDTLPDSTDREIMRRRFFEEEKLRVIAKELGLKYDDVRKRYRKSLERLQLRLKGLL
jgi:RNA polymerase sigma factor (sigma-70 family)